MTLELLFVNISVEKVGVVFMFREGLKMCPHRHDNQRTLYGIRRNCMINRSDTTDMGGDKIEHAVIQRMFTI